MKLTALLAAAALTLCGATARAADLTYEGSSSDDGLAATYSITTDGALGDVQSADIVSYSATLSNAQGSFSFSNSSAGAIYQNDDAVFTPTAITLGGGDAFISILAGNYNGAFAGLVNAESFFGRTTDTLQIETMNDHQNENGFLASSVFATAIPSISAAPEPSSWLLMLAGIGGIGLMLRRTKKTMGVPLGDAFSV